MIPKRTAISMTLVIMFIAPFFAYHVSQSSRRISNDHSLLIELGVDHVKIKIDGIREQDHGVKAFVFRLNDRFFTIIPPYDKLPENFTEYTLFKKADSQTIHLISESAGNLTFKITDLKSKKKKEGLMLALFIFVFFGVVAILQYFVYNSGIDRSSIS